MTRRRGWLIAGAAALVVAAVGGVLVWQAVTRPATPEEAATAFLRALESGDPGAVETTGFEVSDAALTAFADATEYVADAEVASVGEVDGEATAEVTFRLGGEEQTATLAMSPVDGRWTVDASGLGTATTTTTIGAFVSIGDDTFPVDEPIGLLPGTYAVSAAPSSLLEGESALMIIPGVAAEVSVDAALRVEATDAAQDQLDDHLERCTAPADAPAEGCGIRIPWGTEFRAVSEIRYRIDQLPAIALSATEFTADGGVLVATVTGTGQDGRALATTYRTESWGLRGDVSFTADGLELTAW